MATDVQIAVRRVASVNPATGEVLREFAAAAASDVHAAVERAHAAQVLWGGLPVQERIRVLRKFQQLLHARLVTQRRLSRQLIYAADFTLMNGLVAYLTENCCGGASCAPVCNPAAPKTVKTRKARKSA